MRRRRLMPIVAQRWIGFAALATLSFGFVLPILWMVSSSFQASEKMFQLTTEWIPSVWHPENYPNALSRAAFGTYFLNSGVVSLSVMVGNIVFCTLAGYGLAKFRFPGDRWVLLAILCTLTVDDPTSKSGVKRYMLGREPILTPDGERIVDAKGRGSYVTSAGSGPSVGKHLLMAYLPPQHAKEGEKLLVEYFGERYPVTVAVAGSTPLFDPENARIRS